MVKVLIACGSGIATSSYAAEEILKIASNVGVEVDIHKDRIQNVAANVNDYDVCFVTSKYTQNSETLIVRVDGLISGINEEETIKNVEAALLEAEKKNSEK
jgi:PTS system galactitol-specific IIB component